MDPSHYIKTFFKVLWILVGSGIALALAMMAVDTENPALVLASLGGSSFYLFALTTAPASQPRALMGGHVIAALIGVAAYHLLGNAPWVMAVAVLVTIAVMLGTKTIHPPAVVNPLIMIQSQANLLGIWTHILIGVLALMAVAIIWSRLSPSFGMQKKHYPLKWNQASPAEEYRGP